jgi:Carboxypeptidase regulatory-like domain
MQGPVTPVCRVGVPCDAPAAHIVLAFSGARLVRTTRTDASGRYRIKLPAGIYVVHTNLRPFGTTPRPATVRVRAGRSDEIDFTIDTGIR